MEDGKTITIGPSRKLLSSPDSREWSLALGMTVGLTLLFALIVSFSGSDEKMVALFPLAALLLVVVSNFEFAVTMLIFSLFVNIHLFGFSSAVWFSIPFGIAFLLKYWNLEWKELFNPLTVPILVYGVCIIPSFFHSPLPLVSLAKLFNVFAFVVVLHAIAASRRTPQGLRRVLFVFLAMTVLNSLHVIWQSVSGHPRPFGFAGIMFVDYSALALCVCVAMATVTTGRQRLITILASLPVTVALVFTQTRNTWLSALITIGILITYLVVHPQVVGYTRKRLILLATTGLVALTIAVLVAVSLNPRVERRATELASEKGLTMTSPDVVGSSLVSRLFIWDTALNTFKENPLIGVGVYAFPHSSSEYHNIPKHLYQLYVEGNSPHQTHLTVLAETGLIGALGFIVFLVSVFRLATRTLRADERTRRYAFVGATAITYCFVSMVFTDAWMWGQGIVLLGVVIGSLEAIRRLEPSAQ